MFGSISIELSMFTYHQTFLYKNIRLMKQLCTLVCCTVQVYARKILLALLLPKKNDGTGQCQLKQSQYITGYLDASSSSMFFCKKMLRPTCRVLDNFKISTTLYTKSEAKTVTKVLNSLFDKSNHKNQSHICNIQNPRLFNGNLLEKQQFALRAQKQLLEIGNFLVQLQFQENFIAKSLYI